MATRVCLTMLMLTTEYLLMKILFLLNEKRNFSKLSENMYHEDLIKIWPMRSSQASLRTTLHRLQNIMDQWVIHFFGNQRFWEDSWIRVKRLSISVRAMSVSIILHILVDSYFMAMERMLHSLISISPFSDRIRGCVRFLAYQATQEKTLNIMLFLA